MAMGKVQYTKEMREKALRDGKGLLTVEVIYPGVKPGKLGARVTAQSPATKAEVDSAMQFLFGRLKARKAKAVPQ